MTAQRHPMADLLTDEHRARVRAATFVKREDEDYFGSVWADIGGEWCCPLSVALDFRSHWYRCVGPIDAAYEFSPVDQAAQEQALEAIERFIEWIESDDADPADVKLMLGVES